MDDKPPSILPSYMSDYAFRCYVLSRIEAIEKRVGSLNTKESPQAVKPTGDGESLRNLAARENQCTDPWVGGSSAADLHYIKTHEDDR